MTNETPATYFRYCARCGGTLQSAVAHGTSVLQCAACGFVMFQNPRPTVSAVLCHDARVLFCRRANEPKKGEWDLPGGFLEWGEDPIEGLQREMREELGIHFSSQRLLGVYHDWYDSQGLRLSMTNIYYLGSYEGALHPKDDVVDAQWYNPDEPPQPLAFSHIQRVLSDYHSYYRNDE